MCPGDAAAVNTSTTAQCLWRNGTAGMAMPPVVGSYCDYFAAQGYMGYTWPASEGGPGEWPCAPSFYGSSSGSGAGETLFCVLSNGTRFVSIPSGARAVCGGLAEGVLGYEWAV